jgi:hypothetical protein
MSKEIRHGKTKPSTGPPEKLPGIEPPIPTEAKHAFKLAFDGIGGTPKLVAWARTHRTLFYTLYAKLVSQPSPTQVNVSVGSVAGAREELSELLFRRSHAQERERERGVFRDGNHKIITNPARLQIAQEIYRLQQLAEQIDDGEIIDNATSSPPEPLVISKAPPSPVPELRVVGSSASSKPEPAKPAPSAPPAKPPPLTDSELEERRHRLAARSDTLERVRGRYADDALVDTAARAQLDKLAAEQVTVDGELKEIHAAMAARQPDSSTQAFIEWSANGGGLRFSDWSPSSNPNWPRLR